MQNRRTMLKAALGMAAAAVVPEVRATGPEPKYSVRHLPPGSSVPVRVGEVRLPPSGWSCVGGAHSITAEEFRGHIFMLSTEKSEGTNLLPHSVAVIHCDGENTLIHVYFSDRESVEAGVRGYIRLEASQDETFSTAAAKVAKCRRALLAAQ